MCIAKIKGCYGYASDVHHMAGRIGANLMDENTWLPVCRSCHKWIEEHPAEAKERGLSRSRLTLDAADKGMVIDPFDKSPF